ncbi:MAG: molybdenum cofactor biosynthesis protein B [Nannocystaceae bacterium]|nr:molybdenum cofactor biosynthesis protein B [bacterium]
MVSDTFLPVRAAVLTISDTRTEATDTSGRLAVEKLSGAGHHIAWKAIVPDDLGAVRTHMRKAIDDPAVDVLITTGGTGMTPRDITPEALEPLVTKSIPGFGELFRMLSYEEIGTSTIQSRVTAGLCTDTFVFVLPGSTGAVRTAMDRILLAQLDSTHKPCNFPMLFDRIRGTHRSE